jgi:hypothetical protein
MMDDPFFQSDEDMDVMQVDASDLLEEAMDYDAPEPFEDEATTVFSDDQVRGFMDEGVSEDDLDEIPEDEDHTAIFDPSDHAAGAHGYSPAPQGYGSPARAPATMQFSPADAASIRAAAVSYNPPQQAPRPVRQQAPRPTGRNATAASHSSPAVSAPIPRQRMQSSSRPAYQEEATVVTDGAAFRAAAERMNPSLAPPRTSGGQQTVRPQAVVQAPAAQQPASSGGWSPAQMILAVLLLVALLGVGFLGYKLLERDGGAAGTTGTLIVRTDPPGATIRIGERTIDDRTPAVVADLALDEPLVLVVELEGYEAANDVVILADAAPAERSFELQAATVSMVITSLPAGATISVDGVEKGTAPQTVDGLDRSRSYAVTASLDGHQPADQTVRWNEDSAPQQVIVLALVPTEAVADAEATADAEETEPAPEPESEPAARPRTTTQSAAVVRPTPTTTARPSERARPTPAATTTTARPSERARPSAPATTTARPSERERPSAAAASARPSERERPSAAAAPATGNATISVQAVPYGQVWVDGRMVARETPLLNHTVTSGSHRVKVYFEALRQFSDERTIHLDVGASQSLTFRAPR